MPENKLALKKKLIDSKNKLSHRLIYDANRLSIQERQILSEWLDDINSLIEICTERNRF